MRSTLERLNRPRDVDWLQSPPSVRSLVGWLARTSFDTSLGGLSTGDLPPGYSYGDLRKCSELYGYFDVFVSVHHI